LAFILIFRTYKKMCLQFFLCGSGSALDPDSKILWIRIEEKCWIRIRIESIRIHNPGGEGMLRMGKVDAENVCDFRIPFKCCIRIFSLIDGHEHEKCGCR
jgi:hypothetical protein